MPDAAHDISGIVEHFERTLGLIQEVWALDLDGLRLPFQIARFAGGSDEDSVGYATLGLSRHLLVSAVPTQSVREEFLMLAPRRWTRISLRGCSTRLPRELWKPTMHIVMVMSSAPRTHLSPALS